MSDLDDLINPDPREGYPDDTSPLPKTAEQVIQEFTHETLNKIHQLRQERLTTPAAIMIERAEKAASSASSWGQGVGVHADQCSYWTHHPKIAELWMLAAEAEAAHLETTKGEWPEGWEFTDSGKAFEVARDATKGVDPDFQFEAY